MLLLGLVDRQLGLADQRVGLLDLFLVDQQKYPDPKVLDHLEQCQHFDQEPLRSSLVQWPDYHQLV